MQSSRPIVSLAMSNLALAASLNFKDHQLLWMKISQKKYISEMLGFDGFSGGFARQTSIKENVTIPVYNGIAWCYFNFMA